MTAARKMEAAELGALAAANQPDPLLVGMMRAVETLTAEVAALRADVAALRSPPPPPRLLSIREASRMLGVSRTRTLPGLIRDKGIRVVNVNGKPKIPMEEIQRIGREGTNGIQAGKPKRPAPASRNQAPMALDLV